MSKTIAFSFDDGRRDTYTNAFKILNDRSIPFTINVATDFVLNESKYSEFLSADNRSMTPDQLLECYKSGVEIACHGHTHKNTESDILDNIAALRSIGIDADIFGFASPNSYITENNLSEISSLISDGKIAYVRSGIQVKREGFLYSVMTYVERKIHSPWLYYILNRRNIIKRTKSSIIPSVAITRYTTLKQLLYFIKKMNDNDAVIFMFHSVIDSTEQGYGLDNWYFDKQKFANLCDSLKSSGDIYFSTVRELHSKRGV